MPTYLPIRAFNRSQKVRIGNQSIKTTTNTYIDVDDAAVRKQLGYHSAIGAVYPTGPLTDINVAVVVEFNGGIVTATNLTPSVATGELYNRDTASYITLTGTGTQTALVAPVTSGQSRIDLFVADNATGAVTPVAGTAAATGSQTVPATPAGKTALARVTSVNGSTALTIVDVRPRP
jgi:hypothetical protein